MDKEKEEPLECFGKVVGSDRNSFRVQLENGHYIVAYVSGKMRKNFVKVITGDTVKVEISPYDFNKGRIVYRK